MGRHRYSTLVCYPRRAWAATGIVVCWFVCLCVTCESTHLDVIALRLQPWIVSKQQVIVTDFDVKTVV